PWRPPPHFRGSPRPALRARRWRARAGSRSRAGGRCPGAARGGDGGGRAGGQLETETAGPVRREQDQELRGTFEVPHRLLVAELLRRLMAGAFRVLERGGRVAERDGTEEVVRQLAVRTVEAAGAELLERAPHPLVQLATLRGRQILVQRLADERVREAAVTEGRQGLVDEARRDRRNALVQHP